MENISRSTPTPRREHKCAYCGCQLSIQKMYVDHFKPLWRRASLFERDKYAEKLGNDEVENLMSACASCNFRKGSMDIETSRLDIEKTFERPSERDFMLRITLRYGLIERVKSKVTFYYEQAKP